MLTLRSWQNDHAHKVLDTLGRKGIALDASDTGTGKTYIASWVEREYKHKVMVVCPKAVIPKWKSVLAQAGVDPMAVLNVERLKRSQYLCRRGGHWVWMIPPATLVIFDEAHNYGGIKTENAQIMFATRSARLPVLALSATIAYSPLRFRALGYLMGLFPSWYEFWNWAMTHGAEKTAVYRRDRGKIWTIQFDPHSAVGQAGVNKIHEEVFQGPNPLGFRIKASETPGFPENHVYIEPVLFDKQPFIMQEYTRMDKILKDMTPLKLTRMIALREKVELLKVSNLVDVAVELSEEHGVVIFVNFIKTLEALEAKLHHLKVSVIRGDQTEDDREAERLFFVENQTPICICTYGAGGVGLDLHDLHGRPRISILNPTWSAVQFKQALGRIHREDAKSPAVQKLMYAVGTIEEEVAKRVEASLNNLALLQDGDMEFKTEDLKGKTDNLPK